MRSLSLLLAALLIFAFTSVAQTADKEKAAEQAATQWLAEVDSGKYAQSWTDAASIFKASVNQQQWEKMLQGVRTPLGALVSRKVASAQYTTHLPGVPDGEYVVVQFDSSFANKKSAVETVTPMLDKDGTWRVSGYFIK